MIIIFPQLVQRIMEAHANVKNMNLMESKMAFIKAWQALPEYGITYFIIRMSNSKKDVSSGVKILNLFTSLLIYHLWLVSSQAFCAMWTSK